MIGEFTEKARIYEQIAKHNGLELTKELKDTITDYITFNEQEQEISVGNKEGLEARKSKDEFNEYIDSECGNFYFNFYNRISENLELQFLTRLFYYYTYLNYEGRLVKTIGNRFIPIHIKETETILNISKRESDRTMKRLLELDLIRVDEKGYLMANKKYCTKGTIVKNNKVGKIRMFNDGIKSLYEKSQPREHKKLALLFKLIPYINLQWNIVCKNTEAELMEDIVPYSLKELSVLLEQTNITRFTKSLLDLTVNGENVILINKTKNGDFITVNPRIYYKGTRKDELKYCIGLFAVGSNS